MLYSPHEIITELRRFYHFEDGDIIMTGTPAGVGKIVPGDLFEIRLLVGDVSLTGCSWQAL
jgi:2-keto-4-pentenoate hydratase/2-oxohepta-3-ene-1,7-dioic acid hydratase in catechol pathway